MVLPLPEEREKRELKAGRNGIGVR